MSWIRAVVACAAAALAVGAEVTLQPFSGMDVKLQHAGGEKFAVKVTGPYTGNGGYIAFGISESTGMDSTHVVLGCIECTDNKVRKYVTSGYSINSATTDLSDLEDVTLTKDAVNITLSFVASSIEGRSFLADPNVFIVAQGTATNSVLSRHYRKRATAFDFQTIVTTLQPTVEPTSKPTSEPTGPTSMPTSNPTAPTESPTSHPTSNGTFVVPTKAPSQGTETPTFLPTQSPSTSRPSGSPTTAPSAATSKPTNQPTSPPLNTDGFENQVSLFDGKASLAWNVISADNSKRVLVSDSASILIEGKLDIQTGGSLSPWVGIAIGKQMLGANVILGFPSAGMGSFPGQSTKQVGEYSIPEGINRFDAAEKTEQVPSSEQRIEDASYSFSNGVATLTFRGTGVGSALFSELNDMLVVYGDGPQYSYHGSNVEKSSVNWNSGAAEKDNSALIKYTAHGSLMLIAFLFLFPMGAGASALRKKIPGKEGTWFKLHQGIHTLAVCCMISAFAVALSIPSAEIDDVHGILGVVLFSVVLLQYMLAFVLRSGKTRQAWRMSHFLFGFFIFIGGLYNCYAGLDRFESVISNSTRTDALKVSVYVGTSFSVIFIVIVAVNRYRLIGLDEKVQSQKSEAGPMPEKLQTEEAPKDSSLVDIDINALQDGDTINFNKKGDPGPFYEYSPATKNEEVTVVNMT